MYPGSSHRRLSLQQSMSLMRSEPNIHRRCSLDPLTLKKLTAPFEFHHTPSIGQSQSLGRLPLHSNSPSASHSLLHSSPHGSNSHLSTHGSNSSLNDQLYPTFTSPDDPMEQQELRSKSLGNIYSSLSSHSQHQQPQPRSSPVQQQQQQALSQQQHQQQALSQQQQRQHVPPQQASPVGNAVHQQHQHQQLPPLSSGALGAAGVGSTAGGSGAGGGGGGVSGGNGSGGVGAQKRRASYGFNNLTRGAIKRPRYAHVMCVCTYECEYV